MVLYKHQIRYFDENDSHIFLGNEETREKVTVHGTLLTYRFVSPKDDSSTIENTTPDTKINTNGMFSVTNNFTNSRYMVLFQILV